MKKLLSLIAAAVALPLFASVEVVRIEDGKSELVNIPGKVLAVRAVSTVASGTAELKAESLLYGYTDVVTTTYATNFTYQVVWSNGTHIVTNVAKTVAEVMPLPSARALISYTTNETVVATTKTNAVLGVALAVTNTIDSLTCSGGFAEKVVSNKFIGPADRLFFSGTAKGKLEIFVER